MSEQYSLGLPLFVMAMLCSKLARGYFFFGFEAHSGDCDHGPSSPSGGGDDGGGGGD
ncbi:hypothetical protein [Pseudoalteromonas sp. T1lg23B]|uniref:hypothetical protein n=1 Tax=Pseudoalteromonas sp. T1lg23B TaxID=2077097 RepID=UPI001319C863|nr:hypothetical protein [Pseudoalteromonas sp. T1lg23B]